MIIDLLVISSIVREYYEKVYVHEFHFLKDQLLKNHKITKLNQYEIYTHNTSINVK